MLAGIVSVAVLGAGALFVTGGLSHMAKAVGWGADGDCAFVSVHDGDTIRCDGEKIRLANIDAPELEGSPRCEQMRGGKNPSWCDYALGIRSRDALDDFLDSGPITVERMGKDKYGRTQARLQVNGSDAGQHLIALGLARAWVE